MSYDGCYLILVLAYMETQNRPIKTYKTIATTYCRTLTLERSSEGCALASINHRTRQPRIQGESREATRWRTKFAELHVILLTSMRNREIDDDEVQQDLSRSEVNIVN